MTARSRRLPGLERREATRADDGEWILILRYESLELAKKAGGSDTSEVAKSFMKMIDKSTLSVAFSEVVSE